LQLSLAVLDHFFWALKACMALKRTNSGMALEMYIYYALLDCPHPTPSYLRLNIRHNLSDLFSSNPSLLVIIMPETLVPASWFSWSKVRLEKFSEQD
jgi:hypothetical protein